MSRYRYNRAVGAHDKGDEFEADPSQPFLQALLGAGYADPVLEPVNEPETGEDDGGYSDQTEQWYRENAPKGQ